MFDFLFGQNVAFPSWTQDPRSSQLCFFVDGIFESCPVFETIYTIKQYRRHNRALVEYQRERIYKLNGVTVAKNRHKRTGQADTKNSYPSLAEYRQEHPEDVSKLTVNKSVRSYNNTKRCLPGSVYTIKGRRFVLRGTQSKGTRLYPENDTMYYKTKECVLLRHNTRLVFI